MTQTHLADATGLTPVHVNRTLKTLEQAGVVFRSKTVRIDDWDALTRLAEFDRGYLQEGNGGQEKPRIAAMS
jgi:DNA-binding IclR family transcriptional regulator